MIRMFDVADLGEVSRIDPEWDVEAFSAFVDFEEHAGIVAVNNLDAIVGAAMFRVSPGRIEIDRVVVAEPYRGRYIGRDLVEHLAGRLGSQPGEPHRLGAIILEGDHAAAGFLGGCGLRMSRTVGDGWQVWSRGVPSSESPWAPHNRIAGLLRRQS